MSTNKIIGPDKVQHVYPTKNGGTEFYMNMDDPYKTGGWYTSRPTSEFNVSYGTGSQFPIKKGVDPSGLVFYNTTGSPITYASGSKPGRSVRLDLYPDGGKWQDKTNFSWQNNPGYLYTTNTIRSQEFTTFIRVHGDLGTHQSYAHKIGGRDEDAIRSLIEMVYPTATHADIQVNYNYAHFPYVNVKPNHVIPNPPPLSDNGKWFGVKTVHKVASDMKSSDWEMWVDNDPFDQNGAPKNNWTLAATYHDVGTSGYNNIPLTWMCQKDLCRIDGFANVDFTLISDRDIDFSGTPIPTPTPTPTPNPTPTPTPTPTCPPGQHLDPVTNICVPDVVPPVSARKQTRHTLTAGDPVPDQFWTIDSDTGPIPGPSPVPGILPISAVTAIGSDPSFPASNAIDGDLSTGWRNNGGGSWIQIDLGQVCNITKVSIAWYKGDKRKNNFAIDFSADAKSFRNVFTGQSTGTTAQLEDYPIANLAAKLIKITVNGNTDPKPSNQQYAHIQEIQATGEPGTPIPTPTGVQAVITAPSQTAQEGMNVVLDGSNSKGDITAFMWSQTTGTAVTLLNATTKTATFTAPSTVGSLGFTLRVTDKAGSTSSANALVQVVATPPPPCPPGQHRDPNTGQCVPDVTPPGTNVDKFGVSKIYGDGPGSNYFMTNDPGNDPRGNNPEASSSYKPKYIDNHDGSFKIKGQIEIRGAITQDNGFNQSKMCTDFKKCTAQGFMQDSMDWKDIEMTSYYKINQVGSSSHNGEPHIEHVMRGQRSTTSNSTFGGPCTCALGCSDNIHGNCYCNKGSNGPARQKYERDLFHTSGYSVDSNKNGPVNNNSAFNFKLGQWFGLKTIVYNLPNGNVQMEHWTDENATNTWKKTHSLIDSPGAWPPRGAIGNCNTDGSQPITFGGPLTVFRSDNLQDYDIKWQSIRSIDSTKKLMGVAHLMDVTPKENIIVKEDEIYQQLEG